VAAQVFLCVLLVAGAGLFVRSLVNLRSLDTGFQTSQVVAFSADAMTNGYRKERAQRFYRDLLESVRAIPGVESASIGAIRVLDDNDWNSPAGIEGYEAKPGENMQQHFNMVSPGYFATLGMKAIAGRDFSLSDDNGPGVVIVNQSFVRRYFGDRSPLGRHLNLFESGRLKTPEIVGVVSDSKYDDLRDDRPRQVFLNFHQHGDPAGTVWRPGETDTSIRPGWFWHEAENARVKKAAQLVNLYYQSVGRGATLLLNVPPNRDGLLSAEDVASLKGFGAYLNATLSQNLAAKAKTDATHVRGNDKQYGPANLVDGRADTYWATDDKVTSPDATIDLGRPVKFQVIRLREAIRFGQRIDAVTIERWQPDGWEKVASATSIGAP
jgi:hypothetical protein